MSARSPILCRWSDGAFEPLPRHAASASRMFREGDIYEVEAAPQRSASARHYFATLREVWASLSEADAERFPSVDALRQYALIKCGYADRTDHVCDSEGGANAFAACLARVDAYAVVIIHGLIVSVWRAQSQSEKAMGSDTFQRSKSDVLELCASLIGVEVCELQSESA